LQKGQLFGEADIILKRNKRLYTAQVKSSEAELYTISSPDFMKLLNSLPELKSEIIK